MYSYKRTPLSVEVNKAMKMLTITLFVMLATVSVFFFIHTSANAEKGSVMNANQLQQKTLEDENRLLKEQVLQAQSIENIHTSEEVSSMKESENEVYLKPPEPIGSNRKLKLSETQVID